MLPLVGIYHPYGMRGPPSLTVDDGGSSPSDPRAAPCVSGTIRGVGGRRSNRCVEARCPRRRSGRSVGGALGDFAPRPWPMELGAIPPLPAGRQMDVLVEGTELWMKAHVGRRSTDRMGVASVEPFQPVARSVEEAREPKPFGLALSPTAGGYGEDTSLPPYSSGALAVVSPGGAVPVRSSGREAKKLLPPVWLSGRSAEELQQEGIATALNPVRALENGSPSTVVSRSGDGSQERWTDRGAPRSCASVPSLSLLSVRLESGDLVDSVTMADPAEPTHYERRSARGCEPLAI